MKPRKPLKRSTKPLKRTPVKRSQTPIKRTAIRIKAPDPEKLIKRRAYVKAYKEQSEYSTYYRDRATALWSKIVRLRAGGICEFTGKRSDNLEAHHLVSAGIASCRCDLDCGMAISAYDHKQRDDGPHGFRDDKFFEWLKVNEAQRYAYVQEHKHDKPDAKHNWKEDEDRLAKIYKEMI